MSFENIYKQYFSDLHKYAFTILKDDDVAIDVVQDSFLKCYNKLQAGVEIENIKAYLYKIVYNTAISAIRKQQSEAKNNAAYAYISSLESNIQDIKIANEQLIHMNKVVEMVLEKFPEQCKIVFLKSRSEGKKYKEIAAELDISIKTVEAHISKALKIIQEFIRVNKDIMSLMQIVLLYEICC